MHLNRRDLVTIAVLSIIFFSVAIWNLGLTQTPVTTVQLSAGQSFYLDFGLQRDVGSVFFLLKDGSYNVTLYTGAPGNWTQAKTATSDYEYYKWKEISLYQT